MVAEQTRQDQLSNDLANASTPGYKPDESPQHSFGDDAARQHRGRAGDRLGRPGRRARQDLHRHDARLDAGNRRTARLRDRGQRLLRRQDRPGRALHARRAVHDLRHGRPHRRQRRPGARARRSAPIKVRAGGHRRGERARRLRSPGAVKQGENLYTGTASRQGRPARCARARWRARASTPPR